jgi:hypothetical protein
MGLWGLRGRCRGCPVSFLQLAIKPVRAAHWDGVVVQLRNYYLERGDSCTRRDDPCKRCFRRTQLILGILGSLFASPNSQGIALPIFLGLFSLKRHWCTIW